MRRSIGFIAVPVILLTPIPAIAASTSEIVNRIVRIETANPSVVLEGTLTLPGDGVRFPVLFQNSIERPCSFSLVMAEDYTESFASRDCS